MGKTMSKERIMMGGLFVIAGGILALAAFGNVPVTIAATLAMGLGVAMVVISAQTLMQGQTPMDMLGRVTSTLMSVMALSQVGGIALSGSIAQAVGIVNSYYITSALLFLIAAIGWRVVTKRASI
jgi:MFS family permease